MDALQHLFTLSEAYCTHLGLAEGTVSARVLGGGNRLRDLRAKTTDIGIRRVDTAIRWFSDHWPADCPWPADVPRPTEASPAAPSAATATEAA